MVENKSLSRKINKIIIYSILGLATMSCFYPLWYTLCVSLSDKTSIDAGLVFAWPIGFNISNYTQITADKLFYSSFLRSSLRVLIGTPLTLFVSILVAYALSKTEFRARNFIMWLVIFCMVFSGGMVPWYMFMAKYNMTNSLIGLILCGGLPIFYCILLMNSFRSIPKELEEAALIDGAGPWLSLFKVIIPCSTPTIATIALFVGVNYWNDYFQGMALSKSADFYPLMTYIRSFSVAIDLNAGLSTEQMIRVSQMSNRGLNAAKVFVALIPMLIVYPFLQKYFVKGIMIGAIKG